MSDVTNMPEARGCFCPRCKRSFIGRLDCAYCDKPTDTPAPRFRFTADAYTDEAIYQVCGDGTPTRVGKMLRQAAADLAAAPTREELATMLWQLHLPILIRDKSKTIADIYPVNRAQWYEDADYMIAAGVRVRA